MYRYFSGIKLLYLIKKKSKTQTFSIQLNKNQVFLQSIILVYLRKKRFFRIYLIKVYESFEKILDEKTILPHIIL